MIDQEKYKSPLSTLLIKVAVVIFVVETLVMVGLSIAPPIANAWLEAMIDAACLTFLAAPVIYHVIVRPLDKQLAATLRSLKESNEHAEELARLDPLTGVMNRRTFFEHFQREWDRANRYDLPLSCIMVDLDHFKKINDVHGHVVGDSAIIKTAQVLAAACRECDFFCRYGGEEFSILLPETDTKGAAEMAERIRLQIAVANICCPQNSAITFTASFGVAEKDESTTDLMKLVDNADHALMLAKQSGRDRVMSFEDVARENNNLADAGV